jgi:hypothetical protein
MREVAFSQNPTWIAGGAQASANGCGGKIFSTEKGKEFTQSPFQESFFFHVFCKMLRFAQIVLCSIRLLLQLSPKSIGGCVR